MSDKTLQTKNFPRGTVVTVGVFDGVHLGHKKVIRKLLEAKEYEKGCDSVLITFDKHPLEVIDPEMCPKLLTTIEEKIELLGKFNIDTVLIESFDMETAEMGYVEYISDILVKKLNIRHLVVGYDFHLGHGRGGSVEKIRKESVKHEFHLTAVPPVVEGGVVVSSSKIRDAIRNADFGFAAEMLSNLYFFDARVVTGEGFGRNIGFPTANLHLDERKLLPPEGVYTVRLNIGGKRYNGMMNIGYSPTVHTGFGRRVEINVFDLSRDLYEENIRVFPIKFLRKEKRFESSDKLKTQLRLDRENAIRALKEIDLSAE